MSTEQKLCPKCISLHPASEQVCPRCGEPLHRLQSATASVPNTASVAISAPLDRPVVPTQPNSPPVASSQFQPQTFALPPATPVPTTQLTYVCPYCDGTITNSSAVLCPNCNRTLPPDWRDWTNRDKARLTPRQPSVTVTQTTPASPSSTTPTSAIRVQDKSSGISHPSLSAFDLYIKITRGFAYLSGILTVLSFCTSLMSIGSGFNNRDSMSGFLGSAIGLSAIPLVFAGVFFTFILFLSVDVLEMQKANTENTIFIARRANDTEMAAQRQLQVLENIKNLLEREQHNA